MSINYDDVDKIIKGTGVIALSTLGSRLIVRSHVYCMSRSGRYGYSGKKQTAVRCKPCLDDSIDGFWPIFCSSSINMNGERPYCMKCAIEYPSA